MKKKTQISSRTRRQISRGTSNTASLYDALLCMLPMHRYDRLHTTREFSVQMTITRSGGSFPVTRVARSNAGRSIYNGK